MTLQNCRIYRFKIKWNFSTLTLNIYQDESIKQEMVANEKSINAYRPNIGFTNLGQCKKRVGLCWNTLFLCCSGFWPFALIGF